MGETFLCGDKSKPADVVFVCESPELEDDIRGELGHGMVLQLLADMISECNESKPNCWVVPAVGCCIPDGKSPVKKDYSACSSRMWSLIDRINPKIVCPMGSISLSAVCGRIGISKLLGIGIRSSNEKYDCVPVIHPGRVINKPSDLKIGISSLISAFSILKRGNVNPQDETKVSLIKSISEARKLVGTRFRSISSFDYETG
jgi:uracil-DNA glycosylase family 4